MNKRTVKISEVILGKDTDVCVYVNNGFDEAAAVVWTEASVRYCADGAANTIFRESHRLPPPDFLIGDMDSLDPDVEEVFKQKGFRIIKDPCQNTTDIDKCLEHIAQNRKQETGETIVTIVPAFHGRFDHEIAIFHSAAQVTLTYPGIRVRMLGSENLALVLESGSVTLDFSDVSINDVKCALLPIFGEAHVVTQGLKWNMNCVARMGEAISVSNALSGRFVTIETDNFIVFWAGLPFKLK